MVERLTSLAASLGPSLLATALVGSMLLWVTSPPPVPSVDQVMAGASADGTSVRQWSPVKLPARLCRFATCREQPWILIRHTFDLSGQPVQPQAVFIPMLRSAAEVRVNGGVVGSTGSITEPVSEYEHHPVFIPIPAGLLRAGTNHLDIVLAQRMPGLALITNFYVGPEQTLAPIYARAELTQVRLLIWANATTAMLAAVALAVFMITRQDAVFLWFAVLAGSFALRGTHQAVTQYPLPAPLPEFWYYASTLVVLASACVFVARLRDQRFGPIERTLLVLAVPVLAGVYLALSYDTAFGMRVTNQLIRLLALVLVPYMLVNFALATRWRQDRAAPWYLALLVVAALLALHDVFASWPPNIPPRTFSNLGLWTLLMAFCLALVGRYSASFKEVSRQRTQLADTLRRREQQLEASHAQLRDAERRTAVAEERQRIMRDLHDGAGGRLAALALRLEDNPASDAEVRAALADSLDDLRLIIDSLDIPDDDLAIALGLFRHRITPQFEAHRIEFDWQVDVPKTPEFGPARTLHVYRILQEACTNAIRHSGATRVEITGARTADGRIDMSVCDNGAAPGESPTATTGRGLRIMKERAAYLGGQLEIELGFTGSQVRVRFPASQTEAPTGVDRR